jgi:tetratricopeptide (TPR) repeat protein
MQARARYTTCFVALAMALLLMIGCRSHKARREMEDGKKEYRASNFKTAAEHFKAAAAFDDDLVAAKLDSGVAYSALYEPGVDTPENERFGQQAIDAFQKALEKDPRNLVGLKALGCTAMNMKRFEQALDSRKKALAVDPTDPESYFWVGAVDWSAVYEDTRVRKTKLGLGTEDPFRDTQNDRQVCQEIRAVDASHVAEGIAMLQKAIEKWPDDDDAMVLLHLLYLRRADMQCQDPKAQAEDRRLSEQMINEAMAARKRRVLAETNPVEHVDPFDRSSGIVVRSGCLPPFFYLAKPRAPIEKRAQ